MVKKILIALSLLAAVSFPAAAQKQTPPEGGPPKPFTLPIPQTFTLANGMKVTMVPYGSVPKVDVVAVMRVGNVNEPEDKVWLADLTGNLMKEGTTTRSAEQLAEEAASMGGTVSINVGEDLSRASMDVLSEFAPKAVALLADVIQHPALPESQVARLKTDLLRQLTILKTQPQMLARERFAKVLYPNHPYGRFFPTEAMLQSLTLNEVRGFYSDNFGAARTHVYVAGRFDAAAMKKAISDSFSGWKRGPEPLVNIARPAVQRRVELVEKPGAVQSTLYLGLPVVDPSNSDYIALQVMDSILGGSFGSRITANIREQKGYTYSPFSSINARYRDAYWAEMADVTTAVTGPALKEIFYEIDRLQKEPPPADELKGIQAYMSGIFVLRNSTRQGVIGQLSYVDFHGLAADYLTTYVQKINAVSPAQVQEMAKKYLGIEKMTVVVVGDRNKVADQIAPFSPKEGR
jgi:predicted Zn-dependent peptidase